MLVVGLCLLTLLALLAGCTLPGVPFSYNDMPRDGTSTTHLRRATSGIMNASLSPSSDLESRAQKQLPPEVYGYYAGAAGVGATLAANLAAFDRLRLRPDALTGITAPDLSTVVLGMRLTLPVAVAPMALQGLAHPEGEVATARAAAGVGIAMILSTLASRSLEEVAAAAPCRCGSSCTYCATAVRLAR